MNLESYWLENSFYNNSRVVIYKRKLLYKIGLWLQFPKLKPDLHHLISFAHILRTFQKISKLEFSQENSVTNSQSCKTFLEEM